MTVFSSPSRNRSAASNRNCSRKARRSSVSPPPCAYLMQSAYRRDHEASAPTTPRLEGQWMSIGPIVRSS